MRRAAGRPHPNEQAGFALAFVLIAVLAAGLATAVIVPRAIAWHHAALVQHETDCLVSNVRLLQQMTRTMSVHPVEELADHRINDAAPELELQPADHTYVLWSRQYHGGTQRSNEVRRHMYPSGLVIYANTTQRIRYGANGGTAQPMTIYIFYQGERAKGKAVILDSVGRIRVEGIEEN